MRSYYEIHRDFEHRRIEVFPLAECSPHFHAQVELVVVERESIVFTANGQTETVEAGGICVSGSYDVHSYTGKSENATVIMLPVECLQKFLALTKGKVIHRHVVRDASVFSALLRLLDVFIARREQSNGLWEEGWANAVLGLLYSSLFFVRASADGKVETVRAVLTYILSHYEEPLTLQSLSKRFGYSPYHFSRLFHAFTNMGLKQYINSVRLQAAADKIRNGESALSAAFSSGFGSMRSFYRDFSAYYGVPPQRYIEGNDAKSRDK